MASKKMPLPVGSVKLSIPEEGVCHPVVGRTYEEQRRYQVELVTKIITSRDAPLPKLPADGMPKPQFWENLRLSGTHSVEAEMQNSTQAGVLASSTGERVQELGEPTPKSKPTHELADILRIIPIGCEVIAHLWAVDTIAVGCLASTSKACSDCVAIFVSRFHLPNGDYQDCDWLPTSLIDMAEERKGTIGIGRNLFIRGRDRNAPRASIKGTPNVWATDKTRAKMWDIAQMNKGNGSVYLKFMPFLVCEEKLLLLEQKIMIRRQELGLPPIETDERHHHLREMSYNIPMLRSMHQYGRNLKAIRLHETPMLDIRIVELVLTACPRLEVLGIINCELLHFSTIIALLDLLHWHSKNVSRNPIKLDFYPRASYGPLQDRQGTNFISWDALPITNRSSAVLTTILLAILKALPMGIDLVSKDQPFRKFIDLIPMKPGASALFLHHLFTWVDAVQTYGHHMPSLDTLDDLEDQVVLAVYQGTRHGMLPHLRESCFGETFSCCRCGYAMVKCLFRPDMRQRLDNQRVCRVCELRYNLEGERNHRLWEKEKLLASFLHSTDDSPRNKHSHIINSAVIQADLGDVIAPVMANPFIVGPAPDSPYRLAVLDEHRALPDLKALISPDREYDTLRTSGEAALLDAVDRLRELEGVYPDHPTLTRQKQATSKGQKQSWEYAIWKDSAKETEEHKAAGFW
ncbi:uncharacterized protein CTRU02_209971 [Colletotrichum truncatum]|uniref:Uncharacterized protein n=1 Tax=Colletotrichum truncatum TaxID=5467 RepID=A0ACC3YTW8_COLTU|nr:uncharacterized protein CTRU02_02543 [Colletotrichum truncatum]KAF6798569.1 hypothetical protein CTRU02_02543 [Colletotrichum truncatum]